MNTLRGLYLSAMVTALAVELAGCSSTMARQCRWRNNAALTLEQKTDCLRWEAMHAKLDRLDR